jgi:hypothetical protein
MSRSDVDYFLMTPCPIQQDLPRRLAKWQDIGNTHAPPLLHCKGFALDRVFRQIMAHTRSEKDMTKLTPHTTPSQMCPFVDSSDKEGT